MSIHVCKKWIASINLCNASCYLVCQISDGRSIWQLFHTFIFIGIQVSTKKSEKGVGIMCPIVTSRGTMCKMPDKKKKDSSSSSSSSPPESESPEPQSPGYLPDESESSEEESSPKKASKKRWVLSAASNTCVVVLGIIDFYSREICK